MKHVCTAMHMCAATKILSTEQKAGTMTLKQLTGMQIRYPWLTSDIKLTYDGGGGVILGHQK